MPGWNGLLNEYSEWFNLEGVKEVVTLQEGNTPLIRADRLSERLEADVWLKFEGLNPSGSFKDRGMTNAVTQGKGQGREDCYLWIYWKHLGCSCCVRRQSRHGLCRFSSRRKDFSWKARTSNCVRCPGPTDPWQL